MSEKEMTVTAEKIKEPKFHIVKRTNLNRWNVMGIRVAAVFLALVFCGILTYFLTGDNPIRIYATIVDGAIGTERRTWALLQNVAVLLLVAVALTPAFMMRFWNIGAEGQALMGGLAAAMCMLFLGDSLSAPVLMIVMVVTSILIGAIWALIPAFFKAHWNTNETLFTLMMNYIATQIVSYFIVVNSVPKGSGQVGVINRSTRMGWFPSLGGYDYLLNIIIVVVVTIAIYIYLRRSKHGFEISVVGESENTARYLGINVKKVILRTMFLSGAICGLTGLILVAGTNHTITCNTVGGRGFTAIMVSWLAKFNPIYMVVVSFMIVFLEKGAIEISTQFGLNDSYSSILTAIIIFFILGSEFFINYQIKRTKKGAEEVTK